MTDLSAKIRRMPIPNKIVAITMATVCIVLAFMGIALIISDILREKQRTIQNISSIAEVISSNSTAALAFHDVNALNEIISSVKRRQSVLGACIYDGSNKTLSSFSRPGSSFSCPSPPPKQMSEFTSGLIWVQEPISLEAQQIGTILIASDRRELHETILIHTGLILSIIAFSAFIAYFFSRKLQPLVSGSLLALAETAQEVSKKQDYTLRAQKKSEDEVAIVIDAFNHMLTQIEKYAEERESLLRDAQEGVRARDEFMSIASHELKTPITALQIQVQMIQRAVSRGRLDILQTDEFKKLLKNAEHQIIEFNGLVENLLDVTRISSGQFVLNYSDVNLNLLVQETVDRYQTEIINSNSKVTLDLNNTLHGLWDRIRIEEVIVNLLTNALKYGRGKAISISTYQEDQKAVLKIKDQGIGISHIDQPKIFEKFGRVASFRHFGGLGLGLYIVKQIVDAHHGSISVQSEPEKGATFKVVLPASLNQQ